MNEELKIVISAEIKKLKDNVNKAKKTIKEFVKENKDKINEFNTEFQKVGDVSKNALVGAGAAIVGLGAAFLGLGAATAEYRNEQAKLVTAFEAAGGSATEAKSAYNDLYRVLGDEGQATEAAAHLAKITTEEKALKEWTTICQGVYATFGASLPIEGLTEAANETAKVGQVTGGLADALNWAGVSEDDFNAKLEKCNSEAEREKLIRETLNGIYTDAATKYEKNNEQILAQNEAQARLQDSMAKLGEVAAPVNTMLTELGAEVLAQLTPYIKDFAENYMPQIKEALSGVGDAIGNVITWIADNWDLVSTLAAIITGIAVALSVFSTVMGIVNAVMMASPVTWIVLGIVAAVAALVAIIVLVIKYWDEIKAATIKCWNAIVDAVKVAINWVIDLFKSIFAWVKENWLGLLLLLVNPFAGAFKLIYDNCEGFRNVVDNACAAIKKFFADLWTNIKNIFAGVGAWFKGVFNSAVTGIKNVFSGISGFFSGIWAKIKSIFTSVGGAIADAISGAVKGAINKVLSFATRTINGFISAINAAISVINAIPGVNIAKLSKLSVPQLAKGGVVESATLALIGERGKEMVMPLENNLEYLDKLAAMLSARMGTGKSTPIVMQVDGKTFAQISIDSINQLTKLTGSLPLQLG
jgi:phage-related protein